MVVLVKKFARRDGSEQSGSVEQEASINGSPEIRYETVTGRGIEAIVNSLSTWVVSILFASIILLRRDVLKHLLVCWSNYFPSGSEFDQVVLSMYFTKFRQSDEVVLALALRMGCVVTHWDLLL
ncbi:hypothetical protein DY000_02038994 [Brassica cretica]|uniref:Uncharacterized protein n=1 Tax=Brassica cretica TaxID=69181 RepID=A0ABQ7BQD6_BRACR|nr:hypothetical protein DY000_02038994 [Brassica cretica]